MYKYIHTCTYIHIYMSAHIHTYTYIHTHIQNVHMNARKHAWNDSASANARGAVLERGSFGRLFHSTQSNLISHLQCKDFIVPTSWNTNTPPPPIPSSLVVNLVLRGWSTQFIANPCRWPQRPCPETRLHFCHFPAVKINTRPRFPWVSSAHGRKILMHEFSRLKSRL